MGQERVSLFSFYYMRIHWEKVYSPGERAHKNPNRATEGLGLLCEAGVQFCYLLHCVRAVPTELKAVERLAWGLKGTCAKSWHRVYTIRRLPWKGRVTKSSKPKPIQLRDTTPHPTSGSSKGEDSHIEFARSTACLEQSSWERAFRI